MMYDYLIVGAGLFGAVFAREMTDQGKHCLVVEKRPYIGGNIATTQQNGIIVHEHGGHIFHTNDRRIWEYVNRFAEFWPYRHRVKVNYQGRIYSFPFNLMTLHQVYGAITPAEGFARLPVCIQSEGNLRDWVLCQVGKELYEIFIEGYTTKQWGRPPEKLPCEIIRRLPIRLTYNDDYFDDRYQGIPVNGYSELIANLLTGVEVKTDCDFLENRHLQEMAAKTVYTGSLDELFDYKEGVLEYRSLSWEYEELQGDFQGCATVNYTSADVPYTRILEYKHFMPHPPRNSIIAREYPAAWKPGLERYYPINDGDNNLRFYRYRAMALSQGYLIGGRLASYRYMDMHQVVAQALKLAQKETQL